MELANTHRSNLFLDSLGVKRGVYQLVNTTNGKVYVGSSTHALTARAMEHYRMLEKGSHVNQELQRDWAQFGPQAFRFDILEVLEDTTQIRAQERAWIARFSTEGKHLYNVQLRSYQVPNNSAGEELYTPEEVAQRLKVTPYTVRRLLREGKLQGVKPGGVQRWRITKSALEAYLLGGPKSAGSEDV